MSKDSCETVDCCPTCGTDAADELDAKARKARLQSNDTLVARCDCGQLFRATPEVVWITEKVNEH